MFYVVGEVKNHAVLQKERMYIKKKKPVFKKSSLGFSDLKVSQLNVTWVNRLTSKLCSIKQVLFDCLKKKSSNVRLTILNMMKVNFLMSSFFLFVRPNEK